MITTIDKATRELQDYGLDVHFGALDFDRLVRVKFNQSKRHNIDGFYKLYQHGNTVSGFYGSWYGGKEVRTFATDGSSKVSDHQMHVIKTEMERKKREMDSFEPDLSVWAKAAPCESHPYLDSKGITADGLRIAGEELLIPYQGIRGDLKGVQRIFPDGKKKMVTGSKMTGAFHKIDGNDVVAICEGWATGRSIHDATGWTVVCAYTASNLPRVAGYFKHLRMIICADNDHKTAKRIGKNAGIEAGELAKAKFFAPMVSPPNHDSLTDFNDYPQEKIKAWLMDKEPKSFLEQIIELETDSERERFIIDRRGLLGNYPIEELEFLKGRLKEIGIAKSTVEKILKGVKSEFDLEQMRDAEEELKNVRLWCGKYYRLDGDRLYSMASKEVDLLLSMASDDDKSKKQQFFQMIHMKQEVELLQVEPTPASKTTVTETLGSDGQLILKKQVSIQEVVESRLSQLDKVEMDIGFIEHLKLNYADAIGILEACLARKFCSGKKTFVYLKCPTSWGKSFLFDLPSLAETFDGEYDKEDFKGDDPTRFASRVYFFVDEATSFPKVYKLNQIPYRKIYQGRVSFEIGMRLLCCANPIADLERGVDEQISARVVTIEASCKEAFKHCGIERTKSHEMWEKFILRRLLALMQSWEGQDFHNKAEAHYESFLAKYDKPVKNSMSLEDVLLEHMNTLIEMGEEVRGRGGFEFSQYYDRTLNQITSPIKFFKELFMHFDEERYPAFKAKFGTLDALSEIAWLDYKVVKNDGKVSRVCRILSQKESN